MWYEKSDPAKLLHKLLTPHGQQPSNVLKQSDCTSHTRDWREPAVTDPVL